MILNVTTAQVTSEAKIPRETYLSILILYGSKLASDLFLTCNFAKHNLFWQRTGGRKQLTFQSVEIQAHLWSTSICMMCAYVTLVTFSKAPWIFRLQIPREAELGVEVDQSKRQNEGEVPVTSSAGSTFRSRAVWQPPHLGIRVRDRDFHLSVLRFSFAFGHFLCVYERMCGCRWMNVLFLVSVCLRFVCRGSDWARFELECVYKYTPRNWWILNCDDKHTFFFHK